MSSLSVHPATRLCFWLSLLVVVQSLNGALLMSIMALTVVTLAVLDSAIVKRGSRLIWRARWLLVSLFFILAWGIAGDPLWDGALSPSVEGLEDAGTHVGRLLLVLMIVAALLETLPLGDLLAATRSMMHPLKQFGLDPDRGVIRLMLVLRYVETLPRPRDWRNLLNVPETSANERVTVDVHPLRALDFALGAAMVAALIAVAVA